MAGDRSPLRGRDAELAVLRDRLSSAIEDGRGGVVLVVGPPGAGKTRLLQEARAIAEAGGARALTVTGDPDEAVNPHGAVLAAVGAGPDPLLDRSVLDRLPDGPDQGWWLRSELQTRLQEVAIRQPVVVCVDDLQFLGHGSLRLVRTLCRELSADAVVWLVAVRSAGTDPAVAATVRALTDGGADRLDLRPLADGAVALLVADALGATPAEELLASASRAGGHPLLLVELLRGWLDEGAVQLEGATARLRGPVLPARLRDAVQRRTERLSTSALELLQTGAVLGRRFPPDLLAAMFDRPPPTLIGPVRELLAAGLLEDDGDALRFGHDLMREAVVAGVPAGLARALRRHAADVLRARGAAVHQVATMLVESAARGDLDAVATLRDAATALASTASPAAADFSVRALELLPEDSPLRPEVVVEAIQHLWQCGRSAAAEELASTTLSAATNGEPAAEAQVRLGLARFLQRYSSIQAIGQCAAALALPGLPPELRAELLLLRAVNHGLAGDPDAADALLAQEGRPPEGSRDRAPGLALLRARAQTFVAFHRGQWDRAFEHHRDVVRRSSVEEGMNPSSMWEAVIWTSVGHPAKSLAIVDAELSAARRVGRVGTLLMWSSVRARALLDAGRLGESRDEAEEVLDQEEFLVVGGMLDLLVVYALVRGALHAGRPDVVRAHRARVEQMTGDEIGQVRRNGLWLTALAADVAGDPEAALRAAAEAVTTLHRPGPSLSGLPDLVDEVVLARIALRGGARDVAEHAVAAAERRAAANPGYAMAVAVAQHARGLLRGDEACLREAVHLMDGTERPLLLASAREDLARLVARDRPREAIARLDEALTAYTTAGADHDAARARRRLRDLGVRRRRTGGPPGQRTGLAALTPTERGVVRLVAEGWTNQQVAARMFVSPHTVNTHLRNAFTKLGVRSRVELARLVAAEEGVTPV